MGICREKKGISLEKIKKSREDRHPPYGPMLGKNHLLHKKEKQRPQREPDFSASKKWK